MSRLEVYRGDIPVQVAEVYNLIRKDMVDLLTDFRETLLAENIIPNITVALDNHLAPGNAHPFATVGVTSAAHEYLSRVGDTYDLRVDPTIEIFLHHNPMDGQHDEREFWTLANSVMNFIKNIATPGAAIDQLTIVSTVANQRFPQTGTFGGIINLTGIAIVSG